MNAADESWEEESFETAAPINQSGTIDPEEYIIGCCILDEGSTLESAVKAGLTTGDFYKPANAAIYGALWHLRRTGVPVALDTLVTQLGSEKLAQIGGITKLMAIADPMAIGTTSRASHYINRILTTAATRREAQKAKATLERIEAGGEVEIPAKPVGQKNEATQRKPSEFQIPPDDDRSVLLGNRYLNRGDGGILVGSSGMGKSSAAIQMSISWALGLPFQGIKSNGALRILIIQSEDSDGDIAEVMLSMRHMMDLTDEQINQVDQNVRIVCDRVSRGRAFIATLKNHIESFKPDLVIINPLQAFIDGDVTDSRDLGQFLREGLNGLNDSSFGYILIHHTTKPATGKDKSTREWHEVMYDMAGGAELINWARFIISLRASPTEGDFNFVLAKRGRRAGVTAMVDQGAGHREEIITTIPVRHAKGTINVPNRKRPVSVIFWEGREPDQKTESSTKSGRPEKYNFNDYRTLFPSASTKGKPFAQIERDLMPNGAIKKNILSNVLKRWAESGDIEIIQIHGQPNLYRATV